ncbi:hypothetical protein BH10PSE4_BH10PSE4_37940 [soil metagenome]
MTPFPILVLAAFGSFMVVLAYAQIQTALAEKAKKAKR